MSSIAIIPARGGSKRIPKKNIKEFLGRPILEYSIKAAFESGLFDEVMVSTDNKQIAEIAKSLGASVPFMRSSVNSNDFATTINVIEEVVGRYKKLNANFEYGCCLYPSAPFTTGVVLKRFYKFLTASNFDCVFPVLKYGHPIQRSLKLDSENKISMEHPEYLATRTQDLESTYHDAGQFYFFNVNKILKEQKLWTNNTGVIAINEMDAQDIDTIDDWEIAEFKYLYNKRKDII